MNFEQENFDKQQHWEKIYGTKQLESCSWYQPDPFTSLDFIEQSGIEKSAKIIDVGGGDSYLADSLLDRGYTDITVLDISETALERAKQRLSGRAGLVKWIVGDAAKFANKEKYDLWHDRAAFHFLTDPKDVASYSANAKESINSGGTLIVGTFSQKGPEKCSGVAIRQYSKESLKEVFRNGFSPVKCLNIDHTTPFNASQNFTFCRFRRQD